MTGISWLTVADALGAACFTGVQYLLSLVQRLKARNNDDYDPFAEETAADEPETRAAAIEKPRKPAQLRKPAADNLPITP